MKEITLETAIKTLKRSGSLPYIINVKNANAYRTILASAMKEIRISNYFSANAPFLDEYKIMSDIEKAEPNTFVVGLTQYLAFRGGVSKLHEHLGTIAHLDKRVIILCYRMEFVLEELIKNDVRIRSRVLFVSSDYEDSKPAISLSSFEVRAENTFNDLRDFFKKIEEDGTIPNAIIYVGETGITEKAFKGGLWKVTTASAYKLLVSKDPAYRKLPESFGNNGGWEWLLKEYGTGRNIGVEAIYKNHFGNKSYDVATRNYSSLSAEMKWLLLIALKLSKDDRYLKMVAERAEIDTFEKEIFNALLDVKITNKRFNALYHERKELIEKIEDEDVRQKFCNLADSFGRNKIYYLTDTSELERKEIIKCIIEFKYAPSELKEILERVYPMLGEYLYNYHFDNPLIDTYFGDYKYQKLCNSISDEFKEKVLINAEERSYNRKLPSRAAKLDEIGTLNASIKWIDALGLEFAGFIFKRAEAYGLNARIYATRANLPTLTEFNKEFFNEDRGDKKIPDLDKLKHHGIGDYDYSKTTLPLYVIDELRIIDDVIRKSKGEVTPNNKVIIVSDHGASRLVRIANNTIKVKAEVDGKHGGRCCKWADGIEKISKYVTDEESNGYCCIANYDRFDGGRYNGVELHGGASLEEVAVPIIELSLRKERKITYLLVKHVLTNTKGKTEPLMVTLSEPVNMLRLKIEGQMCDPISINKTTYEFDTGIKKPKKYIASLYDGNEEIITGVEFEVKSAMGGMKDII